MANEIRVALLNGKNKNYDFDVSKILEAIAKYGVMSGCLVEASKVNIGKGFCQVTRGTGLTAKTFYSFFQIQSDVVIDTTGTKKVRVEFNSSKVDDGSTNSPDGLGVASINTGTSYPTKNFVKLASITGGVITDEREFLTVYGSIIDLTNIVSAINTVGNITTDGDIVAQGDMTGDVFHGNQFITPTGDLQTQISALSVDTLAFGDGSDGDVVISVNTTLVRDMYYNNLTINTGIVLSPNGYKIYVANTLLNNGTIRRNGNDGTAGANGVSSGGAGGPGGAALNQGTLGVCVGGGAGGTGGTAGAGAAGTAGTAVNPSFLNVNGLVGANGGASNSGQSGGTGGALGATTRGSRYNDVYSVKKILALITSPVNSGIDFNTLYGASGGSGGGGGGGGVNYAGGGGGAGGVGGIIFIAARILNNAGVIEAKGGNGANGGSGNGSNNNGGGGGGSGGTGGVIYLIYRTLTALGTNTVTGGTAGSGGGPGGSGAAGGTGTAGNAGIVIQKTN